MYRCKQKGRITSLFLIILLLSMLVNPIANINAMTINGAEDNESIQQELEESTNNADQEQSSSNDGSLTEKKQDEKKSDGNDENVLEDNSEEFTDGEDNIITPFVGDLNADISIEPHSESIESGREAVFKLILKTTGSQKTFENAKVNVQLPQEDFLSFSQPLEELKIAGITPTYSEEEHKLQYSFDTLKTGQTYEVALKVYVENGITPNDAEVNVQAEFITSEQHFTDEAITNVNASGPIVITKQYDGVMDKGEIKNEYPRLREDNLSDDLYWTIKVNIDKKNQGQLFLDGSPIVIEDILPVDEDGNPLLEYVETIKGEEPEVTTDGTLRWEFNNPSIDEQTESSELFETEIQLRLQLTNNAVVGHAIENKAIVTANFINDEMSKAEAKAKTIVVNSEGKTYDEDGIWNVIGHFGPLNGLGDISTDIGNLDPNPVVYNDARLTFGHYITAYDQGQFRDFKEYDLYYDIDENLVLESLKMPGLFWYHPNNEYPHNIVLNKQPEYIVKGTVNDEERILIESPEPNKTYTRSELGLTDNDNLTQVHYQFTYAPAGMAAFSLIDVDIENSNIPMYTFTIKDGFTGNVQNGLELEWVDFYNRHEVLPLKNPNYFGNLAGIRNAQVVAAPEDGTPIAEIAVELTEHKNGEVLIGDNKVKISMKNHEDSSSKITEDIDAFLLMPSGVQIDEQANVVLKDNDKVVDGSFEIVDNNYNETGRQLVKINWDIDSIPIGNGVNAEIDVVVNKETPSNMRFDVFGFSGNKNLAVPQTDNPSITDTVLEKDVNDMNEDGDVEENRIRSGNLYVIRGSYDVKSEKLVKGSLDEDWTTIGKSVPGGDVDFKVNLTNTSGSISKMTLIDVLPSIGDLGITDNIERGSKFTPLLKGPINITDKWKDKVTIYYSDSNNPKRDDLTSNTIYPEGTLELSNPDGAEDPNWITEDEVEDFATIHSFKIELNEEVIWLEDEEITFEFSMIAPDKSDVDPNLLDDSIDPVERAACNSFAVATDHGQPVEPYQVCAYMEYVPEKTEVSVEKVWEGEAQSSVTVHLLADGEQVDSIELSDENDWKHTFTDLPVVHNVTDEEVIEYTVEEEEIEGYTTSITGDAKEGFIITNTRSGETEVSVEKVWELHEKEAIPVTVHLLQNGEKLEKITLSDENDWKHTFDKLPAFDKEGKMYAYTVEEEAIEGFEIELSGDQKAGYTITNKEEVPQTPVEPGKTKVSVEKVWEGEAQSSVTVHLLADGEQVDSIELSDENDWKHTFTDLPVVHNVTDEEVIEYTVEEEEIEGYTTSITGDAKEGFTIINTRSGETEVSVEKVWELHEKEAIPVTVHLLQNGEKLEKVTLSDENDWKHTFDKLPAFDKEGKMYAYTVEEEAIEGFEIELSGDQKAGYTITNKETVTETPVNPEQPEQSEQPEQPENPEEGDNLPNTATNIYNYLFAGLIFIVLGLGIRMVVNRVKE